MLQLMLSLNYKLKHKGKYMEAMYWKILKITPGIVLNGDQPSSDEHDAIECHADSI